MRSSFDAQRNEFCAYVMHERETPYGLLLGNFKSYAQSTAKAGVRGLWDADSDRIIFGTHQIAYRLRDVGVTYFPHEIERTFTFLPYAQLSEFTLGERIHVTEAFYVPHGPKFDRSVAFVVDVTLYNPGDTAVEVAVFPWALLVGQRFYGETESDVDAGVIDGSIHAVNSTLGAQRWWGGSREPYAATVSVREQALLAQMRRGTLLEEDAVVEAFVEGGDAARTSSVRGRIFGAMEYRIQVDPGARALLRLAVVFHRDGSLDLRPRFNDLLADSKALHDTQRYFAKRLADARFLTPSQTISRGVAWAKANMLRIIKEYPIGWGSTNSPPSDILVSRDTSWFVHGFDYFLPEFSRDAIEVFNQHIEATGLMIEYVRGVNAYKTAYDLNINDDTPLHCIAMLHHYNATLDEEWVRSRLPIVRRLADYLLSQRDERGLLFGKAKGVDMYGISSWRNIIPYYKLDGAVTEINSEGVFALEAAAILCAVAGDQDAWQRYSDEAQSLREATMNHLFDDDTGAFVLNIDQNGDFQDSFTADEIFPVLFNVADADERKAILKRLSESDFTTPVGLRTISTADAWYFPSFGFGLLGGVWPDLTLWYVVALARNGGVDEGVGFLERIYEAMEGGSARNTVPGEFGEWFDGGSLTNRGMYLSPWTGAKYLWAVAETVGGFDGYRTSGRPHLNPLRPKGWNWVAGINVRWGGKRCTYVVDFERATIFTNAPDLSAEEPYRTVDSGRDVSDELTISPVEVGAVAFEAANGNVTIFVLNDDEQARDAILEFRGSSRRVELAKGAIESILLAGR